MKFIILFTLVFAVGCASRPTLEQLEEEANTTGNWTTVERREELIKGNPGRTEVFLLSGSGLEPPVEW